MEEIDVLLMQYDKAEKHYDIKRMTDLFIAALRIVKNPASSEEYRDKILAVFNNKSKILFVAMLKALQEHQGRAAREFLDFFPEKLLAAPGWLQPFQFYRGMGYYEEKAWAEAAQCFSLYLEQYPMDETAWFYFGNCCYRQEAWMDALDKYDQAIARKKSFAEAVRNAALVLRQLGDKSAADAVLSKEFLQGYTTEDGEDDILLHPWQSSFLLDEENLAEVFQIPIFINSRDRLQCLKKLLQWLMETGYHNIYILDNDSTYAPLLDYYQEAEAAGIKILYLRKNMGHTALWDSGILEKLNIQIPYVYTDSDVVPGADCPKTVLQDLARFLKKNPLIKKAGLGLFYEDITFYDQDFVKKVEHGYYEVPIAPDIYFAAVDTTFALYRNYRHYHFNIAVRFGGKYRAYHLPWYYDYKNLPVDEAYYMEHASVSSSLKERLKNR